MLGQMLGMGSTFARERVNDLFLDALLSLREAFVLLDFS